MNILTPKNMVIPLLFSLFLAGFLCDVAIAGTAAVTDSLFYLGHASVKVTTSDSRVIYIDPYDGTNYADSADIVLVTHQHSDHNNINLVKRKSTCIVITNQQAILSGVYQSFTIGSIKIDAVAAYNTNHAKSSCVGYVLEFNGIRLYHAGDTGKIPEMADLASRSITYALLPMDGIYTMTPEEATQAAAMINAKNNIPIHTMPPPDTYNDAIVARFTAPNKLIVRPGQSIELKNIPTSVAEIPSSPSHFQLDQNFPNPFNPATVFSFSIPVSSFTTLIVFDQLGRDIATVVAEYLPEGRYRYQWSPENIPSGIYYCRLQAGVISDTKKIVFIR